MPMTTTLATPDATRRMVVIMAKVSTDGGLMVVG